MFSYFHYSKHFNRLNLYNSLICFLLRDFLSGTDISEWILWVFSRYKHFSPNKFCPTTGQTLCWTKVKVTMSLNLYSVPHTCDKYKLWIVGKPALFLHIYYVSRPRRADRNKQIFTLYLLQYQGLLLTFMFINIYFLLFINCRRNCN